MITPKRIGGCACSIGSQALKNISKMVRLYIWHPDWRVQEAAINALPQFRTMIERQGVNLPTGICKDLTEEQYEGLYRGCIVHEKPLTNALGPDFKQILTRENLIERYKSI